MKQELVKGFGVEQEKISVIPFGINNTIPTSELTSKDARRLLNIQSGNRTLLFFGKIAPYKGLEYLISALAILNRSGAGCQLIIAGSIKAGYTDYWEEIQKMITSDELREQVIERIQFIPDEEVEQYFKAADALVMPYTEIFQSGVPFLAYAFGLPVIATDVGSLRDDVIDGETGILCRSRDPMALARAIETYFSSNLYRELEKRREGIRRWANERHSWALVGEITKTAYTRLERQRIST
jgi:glycosyltransferase involved in cell wall biosynthesis